MPTDQRLPRSIIPADYTIELTPDLDAHTFEGRVEVAASVVEATDVLVCNCADLELDEVLVDGKATPFTLDAELEQLSVQLDGVREPGPITFEASFSAPLNTQLRGFYRSTFTDDTGVERTIATSQLQSTDARRAFPCWDEPDFKATFGVTLVTDPQLTAVSNGAEVARTERPGGKVAIEFARTMVMSTYLVAFVVGPLETSGPAMAGKAGDIPVRILHRPGRGHLTGFALDVAVAALDYFEDYYGIPYPADKLDMIALPDFAMGAMENLGCITYREILLLVEPDSATKPELQNVADVINHEIAHMWFGDLVTMSWWNGIWLNEAFATFMEMKATDHFRPDWKRWASFGISRSEAFDVDSLESTRPIEYPVVSPADAEDMFDLLTYEKGAAVVRMLEQWLGEDTFRAGIRSYLGRHAYGNTETRDLWQALEEASGRPVTEAMETWIFQGGYPVIDVTDARLKQRRFTYSGSDDGRKWTVPVQMRDAHGAVSLLELDKTESVTLDPGLEVATYNHAGHGFYRVNLPGERLAELGRTGTGHLADVERYSLVDDTWALTLSNEVSLTDFFALLEGYRKEPDVSVWQRILAAVGFVHHVAPDELLPALGKRVTQLIGDARSELGDESREGEPAETRQLRGALFSAAGRLVDDPAVVDRAAAIHTGENPDAEMLAAAVRVLAANGDAELFADFRSRFQNADNPQEETRYLYSLALFPGEAEIAEFVEMSLGGDIRIQNVPYVLSQALANRRHGSMVWSSISESWDQVIALLPANNIVRLLSGVRWLTSRSAFDSVLEFFERTQVPQGQQQLDQHLERLRVNRAFHERVAVELPSVLDA